jgi:O-antigen/teichoic acid export membrane protein
MLLIPVALVGVLFPVFSATFAQHSGETARLYQRGVKAVLLGLFPLTLLVVIFAADGLAAWLGGDFPQRSAPVLRMLAIGVFVNGLAHVPFALIQGVGRPDLTAKLHLAELPLYLAGLWLLTTSHGITGAALAWTARVTADAVLLFAIANKSVGVSDPTTQHVVVFLMAALFVLSFGLGDLGIGAKALVAVLALSIFAVVVWSRVLGGEDRILISKSLKILRGIN